MTKILVIDNESFLTCVTVHFTFMILYYKPYSSCQTNGLCFVQYRMCFDVNIDVYVL